MAMQPRRGQLAIPPASTTGVTGPDVVNGGGHRGIRVVVDITTIGTGSWTIVIENKDSASGKYTTLLTSAALVASATTVLEVFPGATVTANLSANNTLGELFRLRQVSNNANPVTGTVGWSTLP